MAAPTDDHQQKMSPFGAKDAKDDVLSGLLSGKTVASVDLGPFSRYSECVRRAGEDQFAALVCADDEYKSQDHRLNVAYKRAMDALGDNGNGKLRAEERAWIQAKDSFCNSTEAAGLEGRTSIATCYLIQTAARAHVLEDVLEKARHDAADLAAFALSLPEAMRSSVVGDKAVLAYKYVSAPGGETTHALILRSPGKSEPMDPGGWEDRVAYRCELVVAAINGKKNIFGRSSQAVDCENNVANRRAGPLELNDDFEVKHRRVTFRNVNIRGGSYSYSFAMKKDQWHLSRAESYYRDVSTPADAAVRIIQEVASYPRDFRMMPMERIDEASLRNALAKNKRTLPP
ncbi:lysozyme inhibitor LprI family protein [Luteibacter sp. 329MFSha]|uniref:lysozyme inhibitor LprI family protein n=1 Tax=Luteibacter sp. 329MFSha TaxID=1798239 RepID=UPI0015872C34|nr:lysozyme inhibitor LprI family protein [Luteibacter sp. 329MFSha]